MLASLIETLMGPLGGLVAGIGALLAAWLLGRSNGAAKAELKGAKNALERIEKGREAVADGRASGLDADQRVRDNDGQW